MIYKGSLPRLNWEYFHIVFFFSSFSYFDGFPYMTEENATCHILVQLSTNLPYLRSLKVLSFYRVTKLGSTTSNIETLETNKPRIRNYDLW